MNIHHRMAVLEQELATLDAARDRTATELLACRVALVTDQLRPGRVRPQPRTAPVAKRAVLPPSRGSWWMHAPVQRFTATVIEEQLERMRRSPIAGAVPGLARDDHGHLPRGCR
jgi:hypothetical protein